MVDTGELEQYLNERSAKKGDIVEIIGEGSISEIPQKDGTTRKGLNIPVANGNKKLIYSPGRTALRQLQAIWGTDTKNWVGKKAKIEFVRMNSFGELKNVLILEPITEIKI
jgi:hypothetical protein